MKPIFFSSIFKCAAMLSIALLPQVACTPEETPDGGLDNIGMTEEQIAYADSLADALYKQARVMQLVLADGDVLVSSCAPTQQEGVYKVTMSTGASFEAYAGDLQDRTMLLSYVVDGDVKYWAAALKGAEMAAFKDAENEMVALTEGLDFKVSDKGVGLKVAEAEYPLGYDMEDAIQVFGYNLLTDAAGVVYAVEFVFGEGLSEIVYVSGYEGVYFYLASDQEKLRISEIYVPSTVKATVAVYASADQQWTTQVADGWVASVRKEGDVSLVDVVPAAEQEPVAAIQAEEGDDVSGPQLQIVSPEGDFVFASVSLVTEPFRSVLVSKTGAVVVPTTGLGRFAYGITVYGDYDQEQTFALAQGLVAGTNLPSTGNGVSEVSIQKTFAEILGSDLDPEERYVLWAYADGVLKAVEFGEISVHIDVTDVALLDAEIKVTIGGANAMIAGVTEKTDDVLDAILYQVNNDIYDTREIPQTYIYSGKASEFTILEGTKNDIMPATTYVVWAIPAVDGEYTYTENDVEIKEFTTNSVVGGGTLELTCSEAVSTPSTLSFDLSCDGAAMIYYAFLDENSGGMFASDEVPDDVKFEQIIQEDSDSRKGAYISVIGNSVKAVGTNLNDEAATTYWLYAVAVDHDGKYGKVHCVSAETLALSYDSDITLTVDLLEVKATEATIKVTSQGGDLSDYIYWIGRVNDPFYSNTSFCASTPNGAQKYMALNPSDENIVKAMRKYGSLASDGTIRFDELTMESSYVFLILEKGDVYYSPIAYKLIKTLSVELGTIVKKDTDKWTAAKNSIKIDWHKDSFEQPPYLMAYYSFDITCPTDMTAYIMCAGMNYYEEYKFTRMEQFMIAIETYASRKMDKDHAIFDESGEYMTEPDYYKNGVLTDGQIMSVNDFYVHGSPLFAGVTYFAAGTHKDGDCIGWDKTTCAYYDRAVEKIAYYNTIEPYRVRAAAFGLKGDEAEDWAQALLQKYSLYYKDAKPLIYINDGSPLYVVNPSATGKNEDGIRF